MTYNIRSCRVGFFVTNLRRELGDRRAALTYIEKQLADWQNIDASREKQLRREHAEILKECAEIHKEMNRWKKLR